MSFREVFDGHQWKVMDIIFASGNGVAQVDDGWFAHAAESEVLGMRLRLCPPEEMIWSKAFVHLARRCFTSVCTAWKWKVRTSS